MGLPAAVNDGGERVGHEGPQEAPCTVCFVLMDPTAPGGIRIATARAPGESLLRSAVEALRDELSAGECTSYDVDAPGELLPPEPLRHAVGWSAAPRELGRLADPRFGRVLHAAALALLLLAAASALLGDHTLLVGALPWALMAVFATLAATAFVLGLGATGSLVRGGRP